MTSISVLSNHAACDGFDVTLRDSESADAIRLRDDHAPSRRICLLRGATAAGTATFTALLSHVASGGEMPGWLGIVLPLLFAILACMFVAGRRPSLPRLVLSVIVSQFLFHTLFGLGAGTQGAGLTLHAVGHHGQFIVVSSTSASRPLAHTGIDVTMWAGHAVAAIITVFALHFGERMLLLLRGIAEQVRAWWGRRVQTCQHPLAFLALRPMPTDGIPSSTALRLLAGSLLRRGPPPHRRPLLSHLTIS